MAVSRGFSGDSSSPSRTVQSSSPSQSSCPGDVSGPSNSSSQPSVICGAANVAVSPSVNSATSNGSKGSFRRQRDAGLSSITATLAPSTSSRRR